MVSMDYLLHRQEVWILPTRVTDRFGNSVTYNWDGNDPWRLESIVSSDGRRLDFTYVAGTRHIATISAGARVWSYGYSVDFGRYRLSTVTRPDGSAWTFNLEPLRFASEYIIGGGCGSSGESTYGPLTGTMTHPSGANGSFSVSPVKHGRSWVPLACVGYGGLSQGHSQYPAEYISPSLTEKRVTGPGIGGSGLVWTYSYGPANNCYSPGGSWPAIGVRCTSTSPTTSSVSVTAPDATVTRYTFGNRYMINEGQLLTVEEGGVGSAAIRTTAMVYAVPDEGPYPNPVGQSAQMRGDGYLATRHTPLKAKRLVQEAEQFSTTITGFDEFARPIGTTKSSSLGYSRIETTTYHDNMAKWILGQVATTSVNGTQVSRADYDTTYALPIRTYSFGKLQQTLGYTTTTGDQDGTLRTVKDGRNNVTTFGSWYRGVPRSITYADGTSQSAAVNADGTIASTTDENSFTTSYQYDPMGRLTKTTYPTGDSTAWTALTQSFTQVSGSEYGIPAGHWRQSITQGDYRKNVFFDALWRPILVHEYDHADAAGTRRSTKFAYDHEGRTTFASYAGGSTTAPSVGVRTTYDALGRVTRTEQDSELGALVTTHEYLSGFQQRVTNPRGQATLFRYQAYDQPTTEMPERIVEPAGSYTYIQRNAFGTPTRITRRNADGSVGVSRYYVYDPHQQLCKRIEPETGATVMAYDAAGNLAWSAGGLALPSTSACDTDSVPAAARVTRGYDARNRLTSLSFPGNNGDQLWDYTPDGLPEQIVTYNDGGGTAAVNAYTYNKRRLLTGESLAQGNLYSWGVGYGYDSLGHLSRHTYPKGLTIDYAPNALGQPTQAGPYATGVDYYPNGAIERFTYGNGIVHTLVQNERGLPERSRDALGTAPVHDDSYDYDANGNVLAISDGRSGGRGNRDMTYDAQDRLTGTTSPMFSPATYTYDVLDNLASVKVAGRNHTYHYDNSQRLTNVRDAVSGAAVIGLGYDAQGNLANKNGVDYTFDHGNRLRAVEARESYRYDGHGRRVQATTPAGAAIYSLYGHDGVLRYQEDYRQGEATNYIYLGGSLVAEVGNPTQTTTTPEISAPATSNDGSYTVSWTASAGADRYVLDESINGGGWIQIAEGSARTWSVTGKTDASYRYRVRACAMVCSGYSNIATVSVALIPQGTPTLSAPAYDADGNFEVDWTAVPLAEAYELREQVGEDGAWNEIADTPELTFDITGRAPGIYGYQVRACNPVGCADWNAPGTVTVYVQVRPNQVPTLTVPEWGRSGSYTISWSRSDGATVYVLEERVEDGAWTEVYQGASRSQAFSGRAAGTYSYRAAACNPAGCTEPSATGSVEVVYAPTTAPVITAPAQNTDGSFTVSWTAVAGAAKYRLEESANGGAWTLIHDGSARSVARTGKAAGSYRYRVSACNAAGCGPLSAIATTTEIDPPSGVPTLTAPALATNGSSYIVSWTAVSGATGYKLQESVDGAAWTHEQSSTSRSRTYSNKPAGSYRYRVRAYNDAGAGAYSAIKTTEMVHKPASAPAVTVPSSNSTGSYTVSWSAVATAARYELYERPAGGTWVRIYNGASRSKAVSGKSNGTYEYRTRACNDGGCGAYGAVKSVSVLFPPAVPTGLSLNQRSAWSCDIEWNTSTGATSYDLKLGTQVKYQGAAPYYNQPKCTSPAAVRACNSSGCSTWSPTVYPEILDPLMEETEQ